MKDGYPVAVVGATGAVGEALLEILAEREFPVGQLYPFASEESAGGSVQFRGRPVTLQSLRDFDFSQVRLGLFSAGAQVSADYAPRAAEAGCVVIDNTSQFRYDDDVPLVVPEVNPEAIADYRQRNIIANPNCSTIQMAVALKPLYDAAGIRRLSIATYQAVSGSGRSALGELAAQTASILNGQGGETESERVYPRQIAFNVLPHIDEFMDNGYTREEMKLCWETRKIFGDQGIQVSATCVRVPVFYGHSEAVQVETARPLDAEEARQLLQAAPGVTVVDEGYPTPVHESAGRDAVFVGRIRRDISLANGLNLWIVADNIRKGAALNSIQIAEELINRHF